jgi:hypothetical protein
MLKTTPVNFAIVFAPYLSNPGRRVAFLEGDLIYFFEPSTFLLQEDQATIMDTLLEDFLGL